jgi:AcrR family transcriptional regulator
MTPRRRYDTSSRLAAAADRRERVLAVARRRFLASGYAGTPLAGIAEEAQVSPEFIHKAFGGKGGLVRAIHDESVLGSGSVPAPERSDDVQRTAEDLRSVLRRFGSLSAEVAPLVAPILLLIREAAAAGDATMAALWEQVQAERLARMRENADRLHGRGLLPGSVSPLHAADVFWAMTSAELYQQLVLQRGWTAEAYGRFISASLIATLAQ